MVRPLLDAAADGWAAGGRRVARDLFQQASLALRAEREARGLDRDAVLDELFALAGMRSCATDEDVDELVAAAWDELALWDLALPLFEPAEIGERYAGVLVAVAKTALLVDALDLAVDARQRLVRLFANAEPPEVLDDELRTSAAAYLDALVVDADVDLRLGEPGDALGALRRVLDLVDRWDGHPDVDLSPARRSLWEANVVERFVRASVESGGRGEPLGALHGRLVRLLERAHRAALADDDEVVAVVAIRLFEGAAELAPACGRAGEVEPLVALVTELAEGFAATGSVAGQVLLGDLDGIVERMRLGA